MTDIITIQTNSQFIDKSKQFKHYKYKEITLDEAKTRKLEVCACVHKTLCSHHRLKVNDVGRLIKRLKGV